MNGTAQPVIRLDWRRGARGAVVGLIVGVVVTVVAVIATFGISMAGDRSWGLAFIARATVTPDAYTVGTGSGLVVVPLVAALLGGLLLLFIPHRRS